jgi:hypothetical protein
MADNDSSIIKPVESLQNIGSLTPAKRREQRNRRQDLQKQNKQPSEEQPSEEQPSDSGDAQNLTGRLTEDKARRNSEGGIDYCA